MHSLRTLLSSAEIVRSQDENKHLLNAAQFSNEKRRFMSLKRVSIVSSDCVPSSPWFASSSICFLLNAV